MLPVFVFFTRVIDKAISFGRQVLRECKAVTRFSYFDISTFCGMVGEKPLRTYLAFK